MTYAQFQEDWERHADEEFECYSRLSTAELLRAVLERRFGEYFQLWRALSARGSAVASDAAWVLRDVLRDEANYLVRYHSAQALLRILDISDREPAEFSSVNHGWPDTLQDLDRIVQERLAAFQTRNVDVNDHA